jgi:hypothetical protein
MTDKMTTNYSTYGQLSPTKTLSVKVDTMWTNTLDACYGPPRGSGQTHRTTYCNSHLALSPCISMSQDISDIWAAGLHCQASSPSSVLWRLLLRLLRLCLLFLRCRSLLSIPCILQRCIYCREAKALYIIGAALATPGSMTAIIIRLLDELII